MLRVGVNATEADFSDDSASPHMWDRLFTFLQRTSFSRFCALLIGTGATILANALGLFELLAWYLFDFKREESRDSTSFNYQFWTGIALISIGVVSRFLVFARERHKETLIQALPMHAALLVSHLKLLMQTDKTWIPSIRGFRLRRNAQKIMSSKDPVLCSSVALLQLTQISSFSRYSSVKELGIEPGEWDILMALLELEVGGSPRQRFP